jgi:hypothetical protein
VVTGPTIEPLPVPQPTERAEAAAPLPQFARTMIIPPRDQGQVPSMQWTIPPIVSQTVEQIGKLLRENGVWISLFVGLAALLVGVTVTAARHSRPDRPHASAPGENATAR